MKNASHPPISHDQHTATRHRGAARCAAVLAALVLASCSTPRHRAPVEARGANAPTVAVAPAMPASAAASEVKPVIGPPPGLYVVKPGDTLIRIGLDTGQNWRDIARWNNMVNPNSLEVGQQLRVAPPSGEAALPAVAGVAPTPRPVDPKPDGTQPAPVAATPATTAARPASTEPDDDLGWQWPADGSVLTKFDDTRNKGLTIAGKVGDPVLAAADGRVVYAGSGLRGYGNLVIVKHNNTFLTAYAHNQALLVKEDQAVRRGQKIAEMGSSDADRVQLHFEIRRQGKPVDPARYLPPR